MYLIHYSVTSLIPPELVSLVRANLYPSRSPSPTLFDLPSSHTLDVLLYSPPRPSTPILKPPLPPLPLLRPIPRRPLLPHASVSEAIQSALSSAVGSRTPSTTSARSRVPTPFVVDEKESPRISRPELYSFHSSPSNVLDANVEPVQHHNM